MIWLLASTVVAFIATAYFSAVQLSLLGFSHSRLEARLEETNRQAQGQWLLEHLPLAILTVALFRTFLAVTFVMLILADFMVAGQAVATTWQLLLAAGATGAALARYAAAGVIALSLPVLRAVTILCWPLTRGLSFVDEAIKRLSGANLREEEAEEELLRRIGDEQRQGVLDEEAAELIENVVEFRSTDVGEVMTPRTDIEGIELSNDLPAIRAFIAEVGHSRIPVYAESLDNIIGILYVKDLVPYLGEDASAFELEPILRQPIRVPETKAVRHLLTDFQTSEIHLAIVIDEYGGTAGLVTIEDVVEEIVGEIHDEHEPDDEEEPALNTIDDMHAEVDGRYHIDDLNEELGLDLPEDEEFDTIGGYVLAQLGHVPEVGESFEAHNARFTAIDATPTHVSRVGIEILAVVGQNGERRNERNENT